MITFDKVTINHNNQTLFQNLNLSLETSDHLGIIGNNSSGKSDLLKVIAGYFSVAKGTYSCPFQRKEIAFLSPDYQFKNSSGIADFFYQQRFNSTMMSDVPLVKDFLHDAQTNHGHWNIHNTTELLGLNSFVDEEIIKLSNGETKRLRLAALLMKNPKLLVMDNPMTGLDLQTRQEFNQILMQIARSGIQLIMTVEKDEIPDIISRITVLKNYEVHSYYSKNEFDQIPEMSIESCKMDEYLLSELIQPLKTAYECVIQMKDVNVTYSGKSILKNINWKVTQGEKWALRGPNGSGKSTLLSLINGDNPQAYANDITLFDRKKGSGETIWDIKEKIGFVSPELLHYFRSNHSCLHVALSGLSEKPYALQPSESDQNRALQWMHIMGIEDLKDQRFKSVPITSQRLILLIRALLKNPGLLLLDEPCQGLDQEQAAIVQQVIDKICTMSRVSLVYVTHYQQELPVCIDHVIELKNGERIA